jgi:hypothetical protein
MKQDTFAEQRAAYKAKMTKLRKAWSEDIVDKNTRIAVLKQDEKDRIVLKRAKALRVKRLAAQERQEATRLFRARMLAIHERKLAKSHVRAQFRAQRQQAKNDTYVSDICAEAEAWITADNVDRCSTDHHHHHCLRLPLSMTIARPPCPMVKSIGQPPSSCTAPPTPCVSACSWVPGAYVRPALESNVVILSYSPSHPIPPPPHTTHSLITEDLFAAPSTTGIITPTSQHWKYQVLTFPIEADRSPHQDSELVPSDSPWERKQQVRAEARADVRLMLRDMLEEVVADGEQRENFEHYIDRIDEVLPMHEDQMAQALGKNDEVE